MNECVAVSYNEDCVIKYYYLQLCGRMELVYDVIQRDSSSPKSHVTSRRCHTTLTEELDRDKFCEYTIVTDKKGILLKLMELELMR